MLQHESQTYNNHSFRVKSLFTKMFFKPVSSFSSYSANLRKTLIWAVPYDRASGVIRCRIRVNTADVYQHNCIQNNMSSLSLSHHALCRDTTGLTPSNKWPWKNMGFFSEDLLCCYAVLMKHNNGEPVVDGCNPSLVSRLCPWKS